MVGDKRESGAGRIMWRRAAWIVAALLVLGAGWGAAADAGDAWTGRVIWVYDGDTLKLEGPKRTVRVRVFGVDCPEKGQPYAKEALRFTMAAAKGRAVRVQARYVDRYGRVVGEVILPDGRSLGAELVRAGLAWHHRRFAPDDRDLARLEAEARRAGRGLWRDDDPTPPWEFKAQGGKAEP